LLALALAAACSDAPRSVPVAKSPTSMGGGAVSGELPANHPAIGNTQDDAAPDSDIDATAQFSGKVILAGELAKKHEGAVTYWKIHISWAVLALMVALVSYRHGQRASHDSPSGGPTLRTVQSEPRQASASGPQSAFRASASEQTPGSALGVELGRLDRQGTVPTLPPGAEA